MGKDLIGKELGKGLSQRNDGKYEARFTDRFGKRHSLYHSSLSQLKKGYKDANNQRKEQVYVKREFTVDSWYTQWIEVYKYEVRDSTRLQYSIIFRKHISPALGTIPLTQLTTLDVKRFLNNMKKSGLSFEVRNKARIVLLDMFDKAIADDFAIKNPARGTKLKRDEIVERRVLSQEEQVDFFDTCKGTFYEELFTVAVLTGLRPGELFALRWEDIDLSARTINITRTLLYQKLEDDDKKTSTFIRPKQLAAFAKSISTSPANWP